jgi:hypothetical protein
MIEQACLSRIELSLALWQELLEDLDFGLFVSRSVLVRHVVGNYKQIRYSQATASATFHLSDLLLHDFSDSQFLKTKAFP